MRTNARTPYPGTWLVLAGLALYLTEFAGMAIAGGYPGNEPGTPLDQVPATYAGLADGAGFLVGWMALVLTGRVLIIVGLRQVLGPSALLDWAVAAMTVSVALEVASVAGTAAAAGLVADGAGLDAVVVADRLAWFLGACVAVPGGLAVLLAAVETWRSGAFARLLPPTGCLIGGVMLAGGLLSASPATYPLGSALSVSVIAWWLWVLWIGVVLVRRRTVRPPEPARTASTPDVTAA